MNENILTAQEITHVLNIANDSLYLCRPDIIGQCIERTDILKITPVNCIIFIWGDSYTGFRHLNERHSYSSEMHYWDEKGNLDNPSRFRKEAIPISDYIRIADELCLPANLDTAKNNYPDLFDVYSGLVNEPGMGKAKYRMILYKNTPIIHTLFPIYPKSKKKKLVNFRRGKPQWDKPVNPLHITFGVPYWDADNKVQYSFMVDRNYETMEEIGVFSNHKLNKQWKLFKRKIEKIEKPEETAFALENADLSQIEKIIKSHEDYQKENPSQPL